MLNKRINRCIFFIGIFLFTFFIIVMRRPDIIFNAQPWAEDGLIWMQSVHNDGLLPTIFLPQNGYYQTISKISFGFGLLFGVENASLIVNCIAIFLRCFMVVFLLSSRFNFINIWYRLSVIIYFLMMPNIAEGYVNITNAHWYLSIYLIMVILADKPKSTLGKIHDYLVLLIAGLSGPFIIFIAPCIFVKKIYDNGGFLGALKKINTFDISFIIITIVQLSSILITSYSDRSNAPLGASFVTLSDITTYKVFFGTFFDDGQSLFIVHESISNSLFFIIFIFISLYIFHKGGVNTKICIIFPIIMIGFSLAKPMVSLDTEQWPLLLLPGVGSRYFIITNIFFYSLVLYCIYKLTMGNIVAVVLFTLILIPLYLTYFSIGPLVDVSYKENIMKYYDLNNGEKINIPINPPGWNMTIIKK